MGPENDKGPLQPRNRIFSPSFGNAIAPPVAAKDLFKDNATTTRSWMYSRSSASPRPRLPSQHVE